ncbi:MAG: SpoIIE family protein phosphatase [Acidobacteria bacterium]|nr:SpoIIE family protein phosphatase [Acidobacteriota bacterium]
MRRLRTQLIVAFVVLSVVPLTAIVTFGYISSERSFRRAVQKETSALAARMDRRVTMIADSVGRDIERVGALPAEALLADFGEGAIPEKVRIQLGENAELLTIDVIPDAPLPPTPTEPPAAVVRPAPIVEPDLASEPAPVTPGVTIAPAAPVAPVARVTSTPPVAATPPVAPVAPFHALDPATRGAMELSMAESQHAIEEVAHTRAKLQLDALAALRSRIEERRAASHSRELGVMHLEARELATSIVKDGETIGKLRARLRGDEVVRRVIEGSESQEGDVVFAVDGDGNVFAASADAKKTVETERLDKAARGVSAAGANWVVASSPDADRGVAFAIARPISESLREMRTNAARNFAFGLGLIGFALIGILPLANHIARDIETVTGAAEKIARGELDAEVRVGSKNEIGTLATAFNGMARDLRANHERLIDEERSRREREIEQRLLAAQYERKSAELEEARRFQLSLLPSSPPVHPELDVASYVRTATEVGGDYWDYLLAPDGTLTLVIGDATGHGARAGTMVTVVKSLFATFSPDDSLSDFLERANQSIRRMGLERMAMALTLARFRRGTVEIAAAGMPPMLVHRGASGALEDVAIEAPPLGTLPFTYSQRSVAASPGDTFVLMTDGFPELLDPSGEPLGYTAVEAEFALAANEAPRAILDRFSARANAWTGGAPPADDLTFVAVKVR